MEIVLQHDVLCQSMKRGI